MCFSLPLSHTHTHSPGLCVAAESMNLTGWVIKFELIEQQVSESVQWMQRLSAPVRSAASAGLTARQLQPLPLFVSTLTRYETCLILIILGWCSSVRNVGPNPDSPVEREETQTGAIWAELTLHWGGKGVRGYKTQDLKNTGRFVDDVNVLLGWL